MAIPEDFVVSSPPAVVNVEGRKDVDIDGNVTPHIYDEFWESQKPRTPIKEGATPSVRSPKLAFDLAAMVVDEELQRSPLRRLHRIHNSRRLGHPSGLPRNISIGHLSGTLTHIRPLWACTLITLSLE